MKPRFSFTRASLVPTRTFASARPRMAVCLSALLLGLAACSDDDATADDETPSPSQPANGSDDPDPMAPATEDPTDTATLPVRPLTDASYDFASQFDAESSSVAYTGQTARHVLILELTSFIAGLTQAIDNGVTYDEGELVEALDVFIDNPGGALDSEPLTVTLAEVDTLAETTFADLSAGTNLLEKIAGNDPSTDHVVWTDPGVFAGWEDTSLGGSSAETFTPETFVTALFSELELNAFAGANGEARLDPAGVELPVHLTTDGRNLQELVEKFLLGAIAFSQGTDDYLGTDVEGKGLLSSPEQATGELYTGLEHAWDEAFGYFGAARDYDQYEVSEIAGELSRDFNDDGAISLLREVNYGASVNAAKRDIAAVVPTDFTESGFGALLAGRQLITEAAGPLTAEQMDELVGYRDQATAAWEGALAATAVHYINDVIADLDVALTDDGAAYSLSAEATHWSELKGFALSFQFNPDSPLSAADFQQLHTLVGDAPVLPDVIPTPTNTAEIEAYQQDLLQARDILQEAYGFDAENAGAW